MNGRHYDQIDRVFAFLGLGFSIILTVWLALLGSRVTFLAVGVLSFFCFACYLLIRKNLCGYALSSQTSAKAADRLYLALNILFFSLFTFSVFSLLLRQEPYTIPLVYFVLVASSVSVLSVEILFLPSQKWCINLVLLEIVLSAAMLEFSQVFIYPSVVGVDSWWHQMFTLDILRTGHVPSGTAYSQFPVLHLIVGSTSLTTGLSYKISAFLSVSVPTIFCEVVFTFLLGRSIINEKVGLLGGLLLGMASYSLTIGYWAIPNTIGPIFILVIVYLLFKLSVEKPVVSISLVIVLMGVLILTHTITSLWLSMILFISWATYRFCNWAYNESKKLVLLVLPILFSVAMLSWWTYVSTDLSTLAGMIKSGFSINYLAGYLPEKVIQYSNNVSYYEQLFDAIGISLFFAVSFIGCLYLLSNRSDISRSFAIVTCGAATLTIAFFAPLVGLGVIEARWYYFSQIALSLPLALAFFLLCWAVKSRTGKILLLFALTFSITFLMILSPIANVGNSTFSSDTQARLALTASELQAMKSMSNVWPNDIGVDKYYSSLGLLGYSTRNIETEMYEGNYSDCHSMLIMIRLEVVGHPIPFFSGIYRLDYDPREVLSSQHFSKVYDSYSVSAYIYSK